VGRGRPAAHGSGASAGASARGYAPGRRRDGDHYDPMARTRDTARPLAKLLRITPEVIPVYEGKSLENIREVAAAVRRHKDETVLVVGHITVTRVIAALGGPDLPTICENVFSDLFLYTPAAGEEGLIRLRYGAPEDISRNCR
jgi:broad specificity phosphatase PhoE